MHIESDQMGQKERLETLLNFEEPDRIPVYIMGMPIYGNFYQEFLKRENNLLDTYTDNEDNVILTPSGDYTIPTFFGTDIITRGGGAIFPKDHWLDANGKFTEHGQMDRGVEIGTKVTYLGRLERIERLENGYGYMWYEGGYLKTAEAINKWFDTYGWPHEMQIHGFGNEIAETNANHDKSVHVIPSYGPGLYENVWFMMGQDRFAYFCRKSPEIIFKLVNSLKELMLKQIHAMKSLHPLAVFTLDDMGQKGRPLISPAMHHKFFFDARKEIYDAIHEIGAKSIMHSCGNIVELLPDLIESGLDGWQTLEPASEIDNITIKEKFGKKMSFWGGVDNNVICFGSPSEVEAAVQKTIRELGHGGGYVAGPAHDYLNTKVDLALAMRDAIVKHGKYPIL